MSGKQKKPKKAVSKAAKETRAAMSEAATSADAVENLLLPDAGVALLDDKGAPKAETQELPAEVAAKPVGEKSPAEWAYERIILYIQNFEKQLDSEHEVVMGFTGGDAGTMRIEGMGFFAPDMITFYGADDNGNKTQMVQHVSQLNVMLRALAKPKEQPEAQRIGFRLGESLKKNAEVKTKTKGKTKTKAKTKAKNQA